jgi:hypothetical protein
MVYTSDGSKESFRRESPSLPLVGALALPCNADHCKGQDRRNRHELGCARPGEDTLGSHAAAARLHRRASHRRAPWAAYKQHEVPSVVAGAGRI